MSEECSHCGATALESADCAMNGCPFGADETEITLRQRISALEAERDEAREALIEAHNCIVKARDLLRSSEALAPGAISRDAFRRTQDIFEQMQKAIAAIRSELANGGRDE